MPSTLPLKWRSRCDASMCGLEHISAYCRIFWELSRHKVKFGWCGARLTHSSAGVTEMLSAFTSPDVLEERMDLNGDVTSLSDYANVIGESHRALGVNHNLKIVFPIVVLFFFFPISDIPRNIISGH